MADIEPSTLKGFSFTLNPLKNKVLLVGGDSAVSAPKVRVFRLDRGVLQEAPISPPIELARVNHAAAIDPVRQKLYVYGGRSGSSILGDLWEMDLKTWQWQPRYQMSDPQGPVAREKATLVLEPRFGKIHITGGTNPQGSLAGDSWTFSNSLSSWQKTPLLSHRDEQGGDDTVAWGQSAVFEVTGDPTIPYPGQVTTVTLESDEPCLGISLTDFYGELLSETKQCQAGPRTLGFMAQPGEIYYVEVNPLLGFDEGNRATFQLQTAEGFLDPTSSWTFPIQPTALKMASGGELGLLLLGDTLKVYDLVEPSNPLRLSTQNLSGFPRDLAVSGESALVASLGPGPDLTAIDIRLAASPHTTGSKSVTGPGRRVATWGGYAYVAGVTKVSKIRLFGGTGPKVEETLHVGGPVTALFAHGGRLFVGTHKTLKVYDIQGESPQLLSEAEMDKVASAIVVHGDTVHVAEMRFFKWLQCMLGFSCSREGVVEVYLIQEDETLSKVGEYEAGSTSLPYLRWSGAHAFALGDQNVMGWRAETVEEEGKDE